MKLFKLRKHELLLQLIAFIAATASAWAASPCAGVNRKLTHERKAVVASVIARQLQDNTVEVLQSFQLGSWSIFYIASHQADDAYVFYARDPSTGSYITLWGGMARSDEEQTIKAWVLKNAPGIPRRLASCFAWHVTKEKE